MRQRLAVRIATLLAALALPSAAIAQQTAPPVDIRQQSEPNADVAKPPVVGAQLPFSAQYEGHLTVRKDLTATEISTKRIKILTPSAVQTLSQQQLQFIEGMQSIETLEAYTQKSDGRHIPVPAANIITRDGASPQQATYLPDLKLRTIIFPDVSVGDTLVMSNKTDILQNEFPGEFIYFDLFPASQSLSSVLVTVEAPASLDLAVKATGRGTLDKIETVGDVRRHIVTFVPEPYEPEEPGAVSPLDRSPAIMVSTFPSYDELGRAYGEAAFPKTKVTPEIAALADEITKNIDGHLAQAAAIDAWVKKNIRYVAIFLSVGRVVPHDAAAILRNKYGDCKDKTTLMTALLAAKGISSEAALINLGASYSLPEAATLAALNHVIVYLPEFDLYDDPTASGAAFGVLSPEAYDKPVVRVSASGAKVARTPAMKPAEHVAHATTTINFAADGTVSGRTQESNVGVLGLGLRYAAGIVQQVGGEQLAQRQLQIFNTPGTGHIDLGNSAETVDPVNIVSSFTLNDRFKPPPPGGVALVPVGLPLTLRPGSFLFGPRLSGRKSAFACYAGSQIEDIEATFDKALPLPAPLAPTHIDNPLFTFSSTFKIEDRTLKIHREFVSRVPGQTCPPETEEKIVADLNKVRADVNTAYRFPAAFVAPKPPPILDVTRVLTAGQKRQLDFFYALNPDCSSKGATTVTVVEPPQHGSLTPAPGTATTSFPQNNPRFECNKRKSEGTLLTYDPAPGFTGADLATIEIHFADGVTVKRRYTITVDPLLAATAPTDPQPSAVPTPTPTNSPAPPKMLEFSRVAVADQSLRVAFMYAVNPDCSLIGVPTVRIVEPPKSGKLTAEKGAGFASFPAANPRSKCNTDKIDGAVISYMPNPGFTGADSFVVDVIYPDGNASKRHYSIEVK